MHLVLAKLENELTEKGVILAIEMASLESAYIAIVEQFHDAHTQSEAMKKEKAVLKDEGLEPSEVRLKLIQTNQ